MFNYCDKCKVRVDKSQTNCPLCGAYINPKEKKDEKSFDILDVDYSYPKPATEKVVKWFICKIFILLSVIGVFASVAVDYVATAKIDWSIHVIIGVLIFWFTLGRSMFFKLELRRQAVWDCIFASLLCLYVEYNTGLNVDNSWANDYAIPAVIIAFLIMMAITMIAQYPQWEHYSLPTTLICVFTFFPLILNVVRFHRVHFMQYICIGVGFLIFMVMITVGAEKYFLEIKKKFHF